MDIIAGISAATEAIKLTKELRSVDREIDKAELKLRLVEVIDRLLEAKEALQDAKQEQRDLLDQIDRLNQKIAERSNLRDSDGLLYEISNDGKPIGEPFCNQCYVKEDKLYRLLFGPYTFGTHRCTNCSKYYGRQTGSRQRDF